MESTRQSRVSAPVPTEVEATSEEERDKTQFGPHPSLLPMELLFYDKWQKKKKKPV